MLSLQSVSKNFDAITVAEDISFSVTDGEAIGIIGPNGAGKTSLFNLISGDIAPSAGTISLAGNDVTQLGSRSRCHLGIARTYQVPLPFTGLTVLENVLVGAIFSGKQNARSPEELAAEVLQRTGLDHRRNQLAGSLSLLDRKRLELARALATSPKIILLDEIAGGLTEAECHVLIGLIREIHAAGTIVIWIEHIVQALLSVAQRLIVLDRGRLVADGEPHAVMSSAQVREIYLGVEPDAEDLK